MKTLTTLICMIAIIALIAGCAPKTRLEMDYGTSYKLQKFNQTLDADAEKNLKPVVGLDGNAAQRVEEKYQKGFEEKKAQTNVYNVSVGTMGK